MSCAYAKTPKQKIDKVATILRDARLAIKNRGGQDPVMKRINAALVREDVDNKGRAELYFAAAQLDESLNEQENRKAYLKQAYDTARFYNTLLSMFNHLELCDSVDRLPKANGNVQIRFGKNTNKLRNIYRANILNGGKYFLRKGNFSQALKFLDTYYIYRPDDNVAELNNVVLWSTKCCMETHDNKGLLKYVDHAIRISSDEVKPILQEYKVMAYEALGNDSSWFAALLTGQMLYPSQYFFFAHLTDYYFKHKMYSEGITLCDRQISLFPDKAIYWYIKSSYMLRQELFDECIECADAALKIDSSHVESHYNRATAYIHLATIAKETACNDLRNPQCLKDREIIKGYYNEALISMELVRQHEPEDPTRWGNALYKIYLNLNKGKEFDEIDYLLKKQK